MPEDRRAVFQGIVAAWVLSAGFIGAGVWLVEWFDLFQPVTHGKATASALTISALPLVAGIAVAARLRHFHQDIDGAAPAPGTPLDLVRRYIQNTTEQTLLFAIAAVALFFAAPEASAPILPVMGLWFAIARALFWIGYWRAPLARAIGFAATFHPTLVLLAAALVAALGPQGA